MEKLANHIALQSITEGGMEKKAFNVAQLLRMGRNFALRGKLDRFNKLMDMRAQAAASSAVHNNRLKALNDAHAKYNQVKGYLLNGDANPALDKVRSAEKRLPSDPALIARNPHNSMAVDIEAQNDIASILDYPLAVRDEVLGYTPKYNSDQLATFGRALKRINPMLHEKVLTTGSFS